MQPRTTNAVVLATALLVMTAGLPAALAQGEDLDVLLGEDSTRSEEARAGETEASAAETTAGAPAQTPRARVVEEIIVRAQKKDESLRDVPISMSVIGTEFLNQEGITDFQSLSQYVPNLDIENQGYRSNVKLRGFATTVTNKVFEPTVGLAVDDVPLGRREYFSGAFFDLERVEVLRGPQGTLFGKNTTAGLIHLLPEKPTEDFTGFVDVQLGELDRRRMEAAVGGPLVTDLVRFRISGLFDEQDGILENTTARVVPGALNPRGGKDFKALRAQIALPDLLGARASFLYERSDAEVSGITFEIVEASEGVQTFFRQFDPDTDFEKGNFVTSSEQQSFIIRKIQRFAASASYDLGGWTLDGIAGHARLDADDLLDGDLGPAPVVDFASRDENPETTAEVRISSSSLPGLFSLERLFGFALGDSDVTAGVFYSRRKVADSVLTADLHTFLSLQANSYNTNPPPQGIPGGGAPEDDTDRTTNFFEQDSESIAGFSQVNWRPVARWTLTYGMRFTHETKSASWNRVMEEPPVLFDVAGFEAFTAQGSRSEFGFTPRLVVKHDLTDDVNLFASWATGFKGGTFNEFRRSLNEQTDVEPEKTTAWEVGTKSSLWGGLLQLNLGLFWQDVTDLQTFAIRGGFPIATTEVANAGKARSRGVEADYTVLPMDWLTVRGALAFTDSEFLEFESGGCFADRANADGDENPGCDLSGKPLPSTPKWTHTLTTSVRFPLRSYFALEGILGGLDLIGALTVEWQDTQLESDNALDSRSRQGSFFRLDGNVGIENAEQGWSLRLVGENLTDQVIGVNFQEVLQAAGNYSHDVLPPRLLFGELRWRF